MFQHLNLITACQNLQKAARWFLALSGAKAWAGRAVWSQGRLETNVMSATAALLKGSYIPCCPGISVLRTVSPVNTEIHSGEKDINPWAMLPQRGIILGVCLHAFFLFISCNMMGFKTQLLPLMCLQSCLLIPRCTCSNYSRSWVLFA